MKKKLLFLLMLSFATTVFAKEINLYDQPNPSGKIVAKADSSAGVIPIFSPKNSEWVKIADPRTGNVGWVKNTELTNQDVAVIQKIIVSPDANDIKVNATRTPQMLSPKPVSNAEMQQMMQRMQMQQIEVQQSTEQLMRATMRYLNMMFQEQAALLGAGNPDVSSQDYPQSNVHPTPHLPSTPAKNPQSPVPNFQPIVKNP